MSKFPGRTYPNHQALLIEMNQVLVDQLADHGDSHHRDLLDVKILGLKSIPVSSRFDAERDCTQRVYHYMLPLEWLNGHEEAQDWWLQQQQQGSSQASDAASHHQARHRPRQLHGKSSGTPRVLAKLKQTLKSFESDHVSDDQLVQVDNATARRHQHRLASPGRFGSFWKKERRCWHNFAPPSLGGNASPSNDPVWRALDQARIVEFVTIESPSSGSANNRPNLVAVIEFRGDGFVMEQVRRIVGSVIAMVNDWLPATTYADIATRPDVACLTTPLAPPGRMYLARTRFHFLELTNFGGRSIFDANQRNDIQGDMWRTKLHSELLHKTESELHTEMTWLTNLRDVLVPQIKLQLDTIAKQDKIRKAVSQQQSAATISFRDEHVKTQEPARVQSEPPRPYQKTLSLLRHIVDQKMWPRTSRARSRVIRSVDGPGNVKHPDGHGGPSLPTSYSGDLVQSGTFTVVNNYLVQESSKYPLGNELFPELVEAIFELEVELARTFPPTCARRGPSTHEDLRPSSTHCAINRNAEFVPHVDSGRGQGQSVSMIVGAGDYSGGELFVEGSKYDIRYRPREFDGWKQRHWTAPFQGERFSLVWFTPAGRMDEVSSDNSQVIPTSRHTTEDIQARHFVQEHQVRLPSYPLLKFRPKSTDALVIREMFEPAKGCVYELGGNALRCGDNQKMMFSPRGHKCVLDVGSHIGAFSRFALSVGCQHIIAYEPEPNNLELLRYNLTPLTDGNKIHETTRTEIYPMAVANGKSRRQNLLHARSRNDGTLNTWRHAVEDYSQYVDKTTKLPSTKQETILSRTEVTTVPLFGNKGAIVKGVTFVKLDCEGAEVDILLSHDSSKAESWMDVTHLVFEWSFTKEKRVDVFHRAIDNLNDAGFDISFEGQGSWWDTESNVVWPYHSDLVVFAVRQVQPALVM